MPDAPRLVIAGAATPDVRAVARSVSSRRRWPVTSSTSATSPKRSASALYAGARALVMPSLDEGFGVPALEAMAAGVPVIASNRGSLPEVMGDAGTLLDPADVDGFAAAMERAARDDAWAAAQGAAGLTRAASFTWQATAVRLRQAYLDAVARRHGGARLWRDA